MSDEENDFSGGIGRDDDGDNVVHEFSDDDNDYPPIVETPYVEQNPNEPNHIAQYDFDEDEDHVEALEAAILNAVPDQMKSNSHPEAYIDPLFGIISPNELLGDDFLETRWIPSNLEAVNDFRFISIFNQGVSNSSEIKSTEPEVHTIERDNFAILGPSVPLYFQFLKSMVAALFWMFLLSVPILFLSFTGSRVPVQDQDAMGIYMFSIGNIGYNPTSPTYEVDSKCSGNVTIISEMVAAYSSDMIILGNNFTANVTETCVHSFGFELTQSEVSFVVVLMELLQVGVFMVVAVHLHRRLHRSLGISGKKELGVSSYTVQITGLDPATTEGDLIEHFTKLYPLDVIDWADRPPIHTYAPVPHCENIGFTKTGDPRPTVDTWVAEVSIHRPMRDYIQAYRERQVIVKKILRSRAQMKMFAADTPLQRTTWDGEYVPYSSEKKSLAAEKRLQKHLKQLDDHTKRMNEKGLIIKFNDPAIFLKGEEDDYDSDEEKEKSPKRSFFVRPKDSDDEDDIESAKPKKRKNTKTYVPVPKEEPFITHDLNPQRPAVAAFVVFEYAESMARCIEDYQKYSTFPFNLIYPSRMLLHGRRITVQQAPEPQNVVWGNFEVSWFTKFLYRLRTSLVLFALLIICFVIILQAALYKEKFADEVPDVTICDNEIPSLYINTYDPDATRPMKMFRPPTEERKTAFDAECDEAIPGSFYARYVGGGEFDDFDSPIGNYSTAACIHDGGEFDVCPHPSTTRAMCPCVLTARPTYQTVDCNTLQCYKDADEDINDDDQFHPLMPACQTFDAWAIGSCYCVEELTSIITTSSGPMDTLNQLEDAAAGPNAVCNVFFFNYGVSNGLTYVAIIVIIGINLVIMKAMKVLSSAECYLTVDEEHVALATRIFSAVFVNISLLVLIAFGKWDSMPASLSAVTKPFGLLIGPYADFTVEWYSNLGPVFVLTFLFQALVPILSPLWAFCCTASYNYLCLNSAIEQQATTRFPMQYDLTHFVTAGAFDPTTRMGFLLALVFFFMMYAPGLPLLQFLAMCGFMIYFDGDKRLLCGHYMKPPRVSEAVLKEVVKLLPFAALLRLAFASWMFSTPGILSSVHVELGLTDIIPIFPSVVNRVSCTTALPLLATLVAIVVVKFIRKVWKLLPFHYLILALRLIYQAIASTSPKVHPDEGGYVHPFDIYRSNDPLRQESAPYTGDYFKFIADKSIGHGLCGGTHVVENINQQGVDVTQFTMMELEEGWEAGMHWDEEEIGPRYIKYMKWKSTVRLNGVSRAEGHLKRTYEVISGVGRINSYSLDRIPAWQMQMRLEEGNDFHLRMQAENRRTVHVPGSGRDLIGVLSIDNFALQTHSKYKAKRALRLKKQNNWALGKSDLAKEDVVKVKRTKEEKNAAKGADEMYGAYVEDVSDSSSSSEDEDRVYGFTGEDSDCSDASESDEDRLV